MCTHRENPNNPNSACAGVAECCVVLEDIHVDPKTYMFWVLPEAICRETVPEGAERLRAAKAGNSVWFDARDLHTVDLLFLLCQRRGIRPDNACDVHLTTSEELHLSFVRIFRSPRVAEIEPDEV